MALNLSYMGLIGTIPPHVGNLSFLVSLSVESNSFHGSMPNELARLYRLRHLSIKFNDFKGEIPSWIGLLSKLQYLDLSGNSFTGNIPSEIGDLIMLTELYLYNNSIGGNIPSEIGDLIMLTELYLYNNSIGGMLSHALVDSSMDVTKLYLDYNNFEVQTTAKSIIVGHRFTGNIALEIGDLIMLTELYLYNNRIGGMFSHALVDSSIDVRKLYLDYKNFEELYLYNNRIGGMFSHALVDSSMDVRKLYLDYNNFEGTIPSTLFKCKQLQILSLSVNRFTGNIPSEIGDVVMRTGLDFSNNINGGMLSDALVNSSMDVTKLYLGYNNFEGTIPSTLFKCKQLQILSLSVNRFMGRVPLEIGNLTMLTKLYLANNNFKGAIPNEIGNLQNLETFDIGVNNFNGSIPFEIFNISTIRVIDMHLSNLSGHLPANAGLFLPNLQYLYLDYNKLSGTIPSSISNASKLTKLDLGDNSFSGLIPKPLGNLRLLKLLRLAGNNLTIESSTPEFNFFSSLSNLAYLNVLSLSANPLNGVLPSSIGNLSTSLQKIYINNCNIKGIIPRDIGNLSNLMTLSLSQNELIGPIPTTVGRLHKLQGLYLFNNRLEGLIPSDLCHLESLFELYLGDNELSGPIPVCVNNLTYLRYLYLDFNQLTSTILLSLWSLTYILEVQLSSNYLSGPLSLEIGNLKALRVLNLSRNQLFGHIPATIGGLKDLANLSLANNKFEGSIAESFGELVSLEFLDLSSNNLSREIPTSFEALSYLKYLNVSFNRLGGKIPVGGPFVHFFTASFMSNDGLCGAPQFQLPPCKEGVSRAKKTAAVRILMYVLLTIGLTMLVVTLVLAWTRCRKRNAKLPVVANSLPLATWRRISQQQILQATKGFSSHNLLGNGSFGSIYQGTLSDGMIVAIKVFNLAVEGAFKSFDIECGILFNIRHRNLVKIISTCSNMNFKALVLEYMPNGNLEKWLYSKDHCLSILQRLNIMINVALALEYLHYGSSTPIAHCDLKPSNILLDENLIAHVADFGIAKLLVDGDSMIQTMTLATIGYMVPEFRSEGIVSTSGVVCSYGILLMETFTRKKPTDNIFAGEMSLKRWVEESSPHSVTKVVDAYLLRKERDYASMDNCISSIIELALQCCTKLPKQRIKANNISITLNKIKLKFLQDTEGS
ncbi:probable LRR receptor-like serine/threonine-protein kinase At3g47570 [Corylus avellana]|uniref:probable LRR receptor-like serine/threonine-protein kinase At3g47570 n=1 Tax=Corylus avellana TaxID=13451 RepID=UPI00286D10EA|nr:probable LRR receptor-like serine/threonine-protein kinase At3g47570 [Corylus avellana]